MSIQYRAYLLRVWFGAEQPGGGWRCSLEDLRSHNVVNFVSAVELAQYLEQQSAVIAGVSNADSLAAEQKPKIID